MPDQLNVQYLHISPNLLTSLTAAILSEFAALLNVQSLHKFHIFRCDSSQEI